MLQCSLEGFIKWHDGFELEVLLGSLAAVVVVSAGQGHPHGREGGLDGGEGAQEPAQQLQHEGDEVDQPVGEVTARCLVTKARHHPGDEFPERQRGIVGDEISLQRMRVELQLNNNNNNNNKCCYLSANF